MRETEKTEARGGGVTEEAPAGHDGGTSPRDEPVTREAARPLQAHAWLVAACLCLIAAAVLYLRGRTDAAFVTAALGILAWFLNVRGQLRRKNLEEDGEAKADGREEDEA